MKKLLFLVIMILSFLPGLQIVGFSQEHKRIVVLGSSTAYGYFGNPPIYPSDSAWANRVKNHFKKLNIIDTLYNLAVSGTNPYSAMPTSFIPPPGRTRPDSLHNITKALSLNPDVIIVNFPSNQYDWLLTNEILDCLETIRDSALEGNIPCYITTTQPRNGFSLPERQKLKELRDSILAKFGIYAIDFFSPLVNEPDLTIKPEFDFGDGIHLNPAGHAVLFNKVIQADIFYFIIPVRFGPLYAKRQQADVLLNWQVFYENEVEKYIVENSMDGIDYNFAGEVVSISNTSYPRVYNFIDRMVDENVHHYRIIAQNNFGKTLYSGEVHLSSNSSFDGGDQVYPTITHSDIFLVHYSGSHNVLSYITGSDGRRYQTETIRLEPGTVKRINVQRLSAGNYYFTIENSGIKTSWKFLKF